MQIYRWSQIKQLFLFNVNVQMIGMLAYKINNVQIWCIYTIFFITNSTFICEVSNLNKTGCVWVCLNSFHPVRIIHINSEVSLTYPSKVLTLFDMWQFRPLVEKISSDCDLDLDGVIVFVHCWVCFQQRTMACRWGWADSPRGLCSSPGCSIRPGEPPWFTSVFDCLLNRSLLAPPNSGPSTGHCSLLEPVQQWTKTMMSPRSRSQLHGRRNCHRKSLWIWMILSWWISFMNIIHIYESLISLFTKFIFTALSHESI